MDVSISIPDDVMRQISIRSHDLSRYAFEALAAEAYRNGVITEAEVQRMLGFASRWETDGFLKQAQAYIDYDDEDLLQDISAIRNLKLP